MDSQQLKALLVKYLGACNAFDIDGMLALTHPSVEFKRHGRRRGGGIDAFRKLAEQSRTLFSTRKQTVTLFEGSGDEATRICSFPNANLIAVAGVAVQRG